MSIERLCRNVFSEPAVGGILRQGKGLRRPPVQQGPCGVRDEFDPGHLNEKVEQTLRSAFVGATVRSGVDGEGFSVRLTRASRLPARQRLRRRDGEEVDR